MAGATELFTVLDQSAAEFSALVPNRKGYEMARSAGARSIAVVLSATDTMNRKNINMTLDETISVCTDIMQQANVDGLRARAYISVAVECPFEGLVSPDVVEHLAQEMFRHGAQECIIADTIGAANPAQVKALFGRLVASFEPTSLSAHFHDTRAMALANIWQAVESGVRKFDASIGGLGGCPFAPGAAGNVATEDVVYMLEQAGLDTGINMNKLLDCVELVESMVLHPAGGRSRAYQVKQQAG
jgi:hydroxymethylglutaryl-CoA lyase